MKDRIYPYLSKFRLDQIITQARLWTWVFKRFAVRPRPSIVHPLVSASGHSFPSGHTLAAAALYVTFALIAGKHVASWKRALALQALASFIIAGVAFSRVYLGVHYPSDVLSGALFGASWAYFVAAWVARLEIRGLTRS